MGKKAFFAHAKTHDFGYGERLVMEASDLRPIEWLWRHLVERRFA